MGKIKDTVEEIFSKFEKTHNYVELVRDVMYNNRYAWGWQRDEYNNLINEKLDMLEKK